MKKPSKCPTGCGSTKITINELGDINCKKCGYTRLSEQTRLKNANLQKS